mgnify:CR=1 FL=1|tara:strand:- start:376 stop:582 length:207 start_codon:yes stop_codon:yes gene_type:complete
MVKLDENPIEDYYRENAGKNLSLRKVSKNLGIKLRKGVFLANNSNLLKKVHPFEVGCGKKSMLLFRCD